MNIKPACHDKIVPLEEINPANGKQVGFTSLEMIEILEGQSILSAA
ncbi:MAG: hypothetical protein N2C13_02030 [Chloroflexota bacterium]